MKIEDQLCFALYSTSRAITKRYSALLEKLEVTYPQYLALMVLWTKDGLLIQELAQQLELEPATTTPLVKRLEKLGLVTRERSSQDERKVHVFLTEKGRNAYKKAVGIPDKARCAVGVSQAKAAKLIKEMGAIKSHLEQNL